MDVDRAGVTGGRAKGTAAAAVSAAYWAAATACSACVVCRTTTGTGVGRASAAPGRAKGPVAAGVSVACRQMRATGWWGRKKRWSQRVTHGCVRRRTSRGREEGRSEVEAKVYVLAHSIWRKGDRMALLEDTFEWEGGDSRGTR